MITNDQLEYLRGVHAELREAQGPTPSTVAEAAVAEAATTLTAALAAAIATIEGLPCDDNGVRLLPGPIVRVMMRAAAKGVVHA